MSDAQPALNYAIGVPQTKTAPKAVSDRGIDYILSSVFFILVDGLDLAIFFLLILSFDMSPFDMLSLWAAGPVVAGLFVSVD
jgi:hypothetical protein